MNGPVGNQLQELAIAGTTSVEHPAWLIFVLAAAFAGGHHGCCQRCDGRRVHLFEPRTARFSSRPCRCGGVVSASLPRRAKLTVYQTDVDHATHWLEFASWLDIGSRTKIVPVLPGPLVSAGLRRHDVTLEHSGKRGLVLSSPHVSSRSTPVPLRSETRPDHSIREHLDLNGAMEFLVRVSDGRARELRRPAERFEQ